MRKLIMTNLIIALLLPVSSAQINRTISVSEFYTFPALPVGLFTVTFNAEGFYPVTETDVEILTRDTIALSFHPSNPILTVNPAEFIHTQNQNVIESIRGALTLENTGTGTLDWSSVIEYHHRTERSGEVLIAAQLAGGIYYDPTRAYSEALAAAGFNVAATVAAPFGGSIPFPTPFTADEYDVAVILTGDNWESSSEGNLTPADEAALQAYQDTGGNVLLVGQDVLQSVHKDWGSASGWFKTHLGLQSVAQDVFWNVDTADLEGVAGTFAEGLNFTIHGKGAGGPFSANNLYIDDLTPDAGAFVIWNATNGATAKAAIAFDNGVSKAVFSTAEFCAAKYTSDFFAAINAIMGFLGTRSMNWLDAVPETGSLLEGQMQSIDLIFDSTGLAAGEYHATITYKNDVSGADIPVEVTLIVEEAPSTATPTAAPPTYTPTPEPTETPPPTPECDYLGSRLEISQDDLFRKGDEFWLDCHVCNNTFYPMQKVMTTVLLGVYGEFWFWPGWTQDFDFESRDYKSGLTTIQVFEPFIWPDVDGLVTGLEFFSGLIDAEMNGLIGEFGHLTFGYTDR